VDIDLKAPRIYRKLRPVAGPSTFAALLAAAVLAQAGQSPSSPNADGARNPRTGSEPPATGSVAQSPTEPNANLPLRREVDRVVAAASAARRLPYHGPLAVHAVGRDTLRGEIAAAVAGAPSSGPAAEEPF
jgi:hypothetical protein